MSEKTVLVFQVLESADWLKLYWGEYGQPLLCEQVNGVYLHYCFSNNGEHLYFSLDEEPVVLRIPKNSLETVNLVRLASWGSMSFDDWYLEMMALTATGYKEK